MYTLTFKNKKTPCISSALLIGTLVVVAFVVRILFINDIPAGIYPDEAVNGTDALTAWENKNFQWFYENNNGREGLYINLISISTALFGNTILGLKFWSIFFGTLSVLGIYLLTKELYASRRAGIIAAFLMTFSFWAINFSRIGFRAILLPLILTFSFYFLFRGIRTKAYLPFLWAGLIFGLGFHTYIAFRLAPAILIVVFIGLLLSKRSVIQTYWKHALLFLIGMILTTAPIIWEFATHPEHLSSRSASISILSPEVNEGDLLSTITRTLSLSIAKYFVWGDQNWRHNLPPLPILDIITSLCLALGLFWTIHRWIFLLRERFVKKEFNRELLITTFLLGWFAVMLAPEFLTKEGLPHALRAIGTQPPVFIFATLPLLWMLRQEKNVSRMHIVRYWVPALLVLIATLNLFSYFFFWGQSEKSMNAFDQIFTQQAYYIKSIPPSQNIYILANGPGQNMNDGLPVSADVIQYFTFFQENITFLSPETHITIPATFLLMRSDDAIVKAISDYYTSRNFLVKHENIFSTRDPSTSFQVVHILNP